MSKISLSDDRIFIWGESCFDLEHLAEGITIDGWSGDCRARARARVREERGVISNLLPIETFLTWVGGVDWASSENDDESSSKEKQIAALFSDIYGFSSEVNMNLRLALTRYFLRTGRPLLPEMGALIDEGITAHFKHAKPWGRPNLRPATDSWNKSLVIAIDSKFPKNRKHIAKVLGITVEGVKKLVYRAREDEKKLEVALKIEPYLTENIFDSLRLLQSYLRNPTRY
ncbi:hypothetical protein C2855_21215 [Aeromonas bestiarum]|uniref:hypothetical protein n=1 Tax=Aeromonas bestiarum TaxID=105751 RepID=UPI000CD47A28|nr:hypothetical protein [Aeromonas bestiarum]POG21238.1 hypothetical protein C2855_21215 [Aeromonas bestiarum]